MNIAQDLLPTSCFHDWNMDGPPPDTNGSESLLREEEDENPSCCGVGSGRVMVSYAVR